MPSQPPPRPSSDPISPPNAPPEIPAPATALTNVPAALVAAPAARAVVALVDPAVMPAITATVNFRPGRLWRNPRSTSSATCSRSTTRPLESRCLTASSLRSSADATWATD